MATIPRVMTSSKSKSYPYQYYTVPSLTGERDEAIFEKAGRGPYDGLRGVGDPMPLTDAEKAFLEESRKNAFYESWYSFFNRNYFIGLTAGILGTYIYMSRK